MSILWADGFEHYGGNGTEFAKAYSTYDFALPFNNGLARTGLGYIEGQDLDSYAVRNLNVTSPSLGQGIGFKHVTGFPNATRTGLWLQRVDGSIFAACLFNASGGLTFIINGTTSFNATTVAVSANNICPLGSWAHLEFYARRGAADGQGYLEARINGNVVLIASGLSMGIININSFRVHGGASVGATGNNPHIAYGDLVVWDENGTINNTFLGDRRCVTSIATANGALQAWAFSGGASAWQSINSEPPGINYIEGALAGDVSEFSKGPLTVLATGVAAVRLVASSLKTDAGAATVALGLKSNGFVTNTPAVTPGTTANYVDGIIELDPNGNIPWTKAAFEASIMRVTKG